MTSFVLHPSVTALWWLQHRELARESEQFRRAVEARHHTLAALTDIEAQTYALVSAGLAGYQDPVSMDILTSIQVDIRRSFDILSTTGALRLAEVGTYDAAAFAIATRGSSPFFDARLAVHAIRLGIAIVVADDEFLHALRMEDVAGRLQIISVADL